MEKLTLDHEGLKRVITDDLDQVFRSYSLQVLLIAKFDLDCEVKQELLIFFSKIDNSWDHKISLCCLQFLEFITLSMVRGADWGSLNRAEIDTL